VKKKKGGRVREREKNRKKGGGRGEKGGKNKEPEGVGAVRKRGLIKRKQTNKQKKDQFREGFLWEKVVKKENQEKRKHDLTPAWVMRRSLVGPLIFLFPHPLPVPPLGHQTSLFPLLLLQISKRG